MSGGLQAWTTVQRSGAASHHSEAMTAFQPFALFGTTNRIAAQSGMLLAHWSGAVASALGEETHIPAAEYLALVRKRRHFATQWQS